MLYYQNSPILIVILYCRCWIHDSEKIIVEYKRASDVQAIGVQVPGTKTPGAKVGFLPLREGPSEVAKGHRPPDKHHKVVQIASALFHVYSVQVYSVVFCDTTDGEKFAIVQKGAVLFVFIVVIWLGCGNNFLACHILPV